MSRRFSCSSKIDCSCLTPHTFILVQPGLPPQVGGIPRGIPAPGLIPVGPPRSADSLLPKCSYINTDFDGDDVGDGRGLTTGSAYECKQACIDTDACEFWTFRRGWARDCYLKRGRVVRTRNNFDDGFNNGNGNNNGGTGRRRNRNRNKRQTRRGNGGRRRRGNS